MKKRTAIIGALVSLMPLGQPLVIVTGAVLTSTAVILFAPEKVNAESSILRNNLGNKKKGKSESAESFYETGAKEWADGDDYAAISSYSKAIKLKPNFRDAYVARCGSFLNISRYKDAIKDCSKAISLGGNSAGVYRNLCGAYGGLERFKVAEGYCDQAIGLNDKDDMAYLNRGIVRYLRNNPKAACSDWREALSLASSTSVRDRTRQKILLDLIEQNCLS